MNITLYNHRLSIKNNEYAYIYDIDRCYVSVIPHLRRCGVKFKKKQLISEYIKKYVDLIFCAQKNKPFFHIESNLPFCWNAPSKGGWSINYIKYEWGHINSINQNGSYSHNIRNLCLQSARCNQHMQSSLNIIELMEYGGKLSEVIERNMAERENLFLSEEWIITENYLLSDV